MNVLNKRFTAEGLEWLKNQKTMLLIRHGKEVREYEARIAEYNRLIVDGNNTDAKMAFHSLIIFFDEKLTKTATELKVLEKMQDGEIWN